MAEEKQDDYDWALRTIQRQLYDGQRHPITITTDRGLALINAIRSVFPTTNNVLCFWHIQKNSLAKGKSPFNGDDDAWERFFGGMWNSMVHSLEVDDFNTGWDLFKETYGTTQHVKCIEETWMTYKELFGKPWTRRFLHLGSTTTSRVESAHHVIKSYIKVSTGHHLDENP